MERVYRELLTRAEQAIGEAGRQQKRAGELTAFVQALRKTGPAGIVRCAWCDRDAADGQWIDPRSLLGSNIRQRLRDNASHGICPDCFDRVSREADRQRAQ